MCCVLGCASLSGCAFFSPSRAAEKDYERARRDVEEGGVRQASYEADAPEESTQQQTPNDDFALDGVGRRLKSMAGQGPNRQRARDHFEEAEALFREAAALPPDESSRRNSLYADAAGSFESAAKWFPNSSLEQDALFYCGECWFFSDSYPKANKAYEKLLKKHPNTRHLDTVEQRRFSIAKYWLDTFNDDKPAFYEFNFFDRKLPRSGLQKQAVRIWDRIRIDDPTGQLADDATMAAGKAEFAQGRYEKADQFFTDLRKTFPSSKHQFEAHLLGIKAKLESYRGSAYGGDGLDEAENLIRQVRKQFPREAEAETNYLKQAYAEVRYRKAEREWADATYYDNLKQFGAARKHYRAVAEEFSDTPLARKAQDRLAELTGEPDKPPQRFAWLEDLVDHDKKASKPLFARNPVTSSSTKKR